MPNSATLRSRNRTTIVHCSYTVYRTPCRFVELDLQCKVQEESGYSNRVKIRLFLLYHWHTYNAFKDENFGSAKQYTKIERTRQLALVRKRAGQKGLVFPRFKGQSAVLGQNDACFVGQTVGCVNNQLLQLF